MSRHNLAWPLGISALSVFTFFVSVGATAHQQDQDYENVKLFVDVLHEVRSRYVYKLTPERERKLVEDMLNGGLERLNPHNAFISKDDYKQFSRRSAGKFGGVGIHIGYDAQNRGQITVISPMVGTPAYKAGVLAGDIILKIDGKSTENLRTNEAIELILGDEGTKVVLNVRHEDGEVEDIPIVRAEIRVPTVLGDLRKKDPPTEWDYLYDKENKIGYLRLTEFARTSSEEMKKALKELKAAGVRGLVLDLRGNPGGLLQSAKEISNYFLSEGKIVSTRGRDGEEEVATADPREAILGPESGVPVVVLVNRYSASASEIVSAALQDHDRAVVVGERSYGKGSVQNVIPMERGASALKLTTASYWRPSGRNIDRHPDSKETDEWGVKPNKGFEVEVTPEQRTEYVRWRNNRDIVRDSKRHTPKEPKKPAREKDAKQEENKKPYSDPVMEKAMKYLRGKIKKAGRDIPLHFRAAA
jgi:carboxyl-terminal processing protease